MRIKRTTADYIPLTKENYYGAIHCKVLAEKNKDMAAIQKDYNKAYALNKNHYQMGYEKPVEENNQVILNFKHAEAAFDFFSQEAAKGKSFIVADDNQKVVGFSVGDGKLLSSHDKECKNYLDFSAKSKLALDDTFKNDFDQKVKGTDVSVGKGSKKGG